MSFLQMGFGFAESETVRVAPQKQPIFRTAAEAPAPQPSPTPQASSEAAQPSELTATQLFEKRKGYAGATLATGEATIAAIRTFKRLAQSGNLPSQSEREALASFSGFGPVANKLFPRPDTGEYSSESWQALGQELESLLNPTQYASAKRATFSAFYTDPLIMQTMYDLLLRSGLPRGAKILEPGSGVGNFIGLGQELGYQMTGVEQEVVSAEISKMLWLNQRIVSASFQRFNCPDNSFDAAIGNVPFSDLKVAYGKDSLSLHNYFFARTLDLLKPSGLMALITSRYFLDGKNPKFREYMAQRAYFLGSLRLWSNAFQKEGTDVVADVLVFQKLGEGEQPALDGGGFLKAYKFGDGDLNLHYLTQPARVIGELELASSQYGGKVVSVKAPDNPPEALSAAVDTFPDLSVLPPLQVPSVPPSVFESIPKAKPNKQPSMQAVNGSGKIQAAPRKLPNKPFRDLPTELSRYLSIPIVGELLVDGEHIVEATDNYGGFQPLVYGGREILWHKGKTGKRLFALVALKEAARAALEAQSQRAPVEVRQLAREILNERYDYFSNNFGPINRVSITHNKSGVESRRMVNTAGFTSDSFCYLVAALEQYSEASDTATKMPIMVEDVVIPARELSATTEDPKVAYLMSLDTHGSVDIDFIAQRLQSTRQEAIDGISEFVFFDPVRQWYVPKDEYLSGDIRLKLTAARQAAEADETFRPNVDALEAAMPDPIESGGITVGLGATWVPVEIIADFAAYITDSSVKDIAVSLNKKDASWVVRFAGGAKESNHSRVIYGTLDRPATKLLNDALNFRFPTIWSYVGSGSSERRIVDSEGTAAVRSKLRVIRNRFHDWLFEDFERGVTISEIYNQAFNSSQLRAYDGSHLTFPDMSPTIGLGIHQMDAVWRIISSRNAGTLLAHVVGGGKTFTMIAAAMKLKQAGIIHKPWFVVPGHMIAQFATEFYRLYPKAQLLVADRDKASKANRAKFVADAAMGQWDGVIISHRAFEKIPVSTEFQMRFVREQIQEYERLLLQTGKSENSEFGAERRHIKKIEKRKEKWEDRLQTLLEAGKDQGLNIETTGIDMLFVDEAHAFKNLDTPTNMERVSGVGEGGSNRAFDMFMKCNWIRQSGGKICFATGTPVANSMVELYTLKRMLAPQLLEAAGIGHFDAWANTFGEIVEDLVLSPDAKTLKAKRSFSRFVNLPEVVSMFRTFADVQNRADLNLPTPAIIGGKPKVIAVPMADAQDRVQNALIERYSAIVNGEVKPWEDTALQITTDGRLLALDARLVAGWGKRDIPIADGETTGFKLEAVATNVHQIWKETAATKSAQIIFSDIGVNANVKSGYSGYDTLVELLIERGIPKEQIARMDKVTTDAAKHSTFTRMRSGDLRVLIGSTERMGTGTNIQDRLVALHHVDVPWRPADIEQREGRILRQGNVVHDEIHIFRYVTERSFDAYIWQSLETKSAFIAQVMVSGSSVRESADVDGLTLEFAEVKAIASGNPAVIALARMDMLLKHLHQLRSAHTAQKFKLSREIELDQQSLNQATQTRAVYAANVDRMSKYDDAFTLIATGEVFADEDTLQRGIANYMKEAWPKLKESLVNAAIAASTQIKRSTIKIGEYRGEDVRFSMKVQKRFGSSAWDDCLVDASIVLDCRGVDSLGINGAGSKRFAQIVYNLYKEQVQGLDYQDQRVRQLSEKNVGQRLGQDENEFAYADEIELLGGLVLEMQAILSKNSGDDDAAQAAKSGDRIKEIKDIYDQINRRVA